jgi:phosphoserine phosphatase
MESKQFDEIYSYSDSIHDLPLLEFSHFPCTISPDEKLRKVAEDRKWLIEDRRNPHS